MHETDLETENGATPIPTSFFHKGVGDHVFRTSFQENHAVEQYFWTRETVEKLIVACQYVFQEKTCCLMTPSLAHEWSNQGRDEVLLDIDTRFDFVPKFQYYDVTDPCDIDGDFRLLILDPPFFLLPIEIVREAVDKLTNCDYSTRIMIAFLKRGEKRLRKAFADYNLVPTHFPLQYACIKPNKWSNFVLYSNIELPGVKKMKE